MNQTERQKYFLRNAVRNNLYFLCSICQPPEEIANSCEQFQSGLGGGTL